MATETKKKKDLRRLQLEEEQIRLQQLKIKLELEALDTASDEDMTGVGITTSSDEPFILEGA